MQSSPFSATRQFRGSGGLDLRTVGCCWQALGPLHLLLSKWQSEEPEGNFRRVFFSSSCNICLLGSLLWQLCWKLWSSPWPCGVFTLLRGYPELCRILLPDFLLFCHFPPPILWPLNPLRTTFKVKIKCAEWDEMHYYYFFQLINSFLTRHSAFLICLAGFILLQTMQFHHHWAFEGAALHICIILSASDFLGALTSLIFLVFYSVLLRNGFLTSALFQWNVVSIKTT